MPFHLMATAFKPFGVLDRGFFSIIFTPGGPSPPMLLLHHVCILEYEANVSSYPESGHGYSSLPLFGN